jgi:hypothetical protein
MQSADKAEHAALCKAEVIQQLTFWRGKNELQIVIMQFTF